MVCKVTINGTEYYGETIADVRCVLEQHMEVWADAVDVVKEVEFVEMPEDEFWSLPEWEC